MKRQHLFIVVASLLVSPLAGCHHRAFSTKISVADDLTDSAYAEQNGALEWHSEGPNLPEFKVTFPDFATANGPCRADDILHGKQVVCHVARTGMFRYVISPYPEPANASKDTINLANPTPSYAKVVSCSGCKNPTPPLKSAAATSNAAEARTSSASAGVTSALSVDYLIDIACVNNAAVANGLPPHNSPPTVSVKQTLEWRATGYDSDFRAVFDPQNNPCSTNNSFGPGDVCAIDPGASGKTYTYTVSRTDCNNQSTKTFSVQ